LGQKISTLFDALDEREIARYLSVLRAKKTNWDKTAIFLSVWRQKKKTRNIVVCKYII
jgi:hypothetical protein